MTGHILADGLALAMILLPATVFCLAARRLRRSRSRNAALYAFAGAFALAGATGAARTGLAGAAWDAGGTVVAAASLPLWLVVRMIAARRPPPQPGMVFTSARRGGLRGRARGLTREA